MPSRKLIILLILFIGLMSLACRSATAVAPATQTLPEATDLISTVSAIISTTTPEPTTTETITPSPESGLTATAPLVYINPPTTEFNGSFIYKALAGNLSQYIELNFDEAQWTVSAEEDLLIHKNLVGCTIKPSGQSGAPPGYSVEKSQLRAGSVDYAKQSFSFQDQLRFVSYCAADLGNNSGTCLAVNFGEEIASCLSSAEITLSALHLAPDIKPTITPSPQPSPTGTPTPYEACVGAPPTRMWISGYAYVNLEPPIPNRIRSGPGTAYDIIGTIDPGKVMLVLDGPRCQDGWAWWQVRNIESGLTGWTAEGDIESYWLVPCANEELCQAGIR